MSPIEQLAELLRAIMALTQMERRILLDAVRAMQEKKT